MIISQHLLKFVSIPPTPGIYATYKFNNSRTLVAGLNSIQPSSNTDHEISTHTDNVFSTIIRASERIPYDSAIFLFTNSEPVEDEVAQTAAIMLLKKRIRVSSPLYKFMMNVAVLGHAVLFYYYFILLNRSKQSTKQCC